MIEMSGVTKKNSLMTLNLFDKMLSSIWIPSLNLNLKINILQINQKDILYYVTHNIQYICIDINIFFITNNLVLNKTYLSHKGISIRKKM